jgi:hypothetical protein
MRLVQLKELERWSKLNDQNETSSLKMQNTSLKVSLQIKFGERSLRLELKVRRKTSTWVATVLIKG